MTLIKYYYVKITQSVWIQLIGSVAPNLHFTIIESCKIVIKLYGENLLGLVKIMACYSQSDREPFKAPPSDLH